MDEIGTAESESPPVAAPEKRKRGRPKGGARPNSGPPKGPSRNTRRLIEIRAKEMVVELLAAERSKKPSLYDITKAAAEFHYGEAAKAQLVIRNPQSSQSDIAAARKSLEHHIDKASHHAKQALPYELAKLGPQKPPPKKDADTIDWSRINDGDLEMLEKIVAAATGVDGGTKNN